MSRSVGLVVLGLGLALIGCDSSDGEPESSVATFDELAASIARVTCESLGGCCTEQGVRFDRKTCETEAASIAQKGFSNDREDLSTVYDAAIGAECFEAIKSHVVCGQLDDSNGILAACDVLFHGEVAAGDACESGDQCLRGPGQGARCGDEGRCIVYSRREASRGKLGDACRGTCRTSDCIVETDHHPALEGTGGPDVSCFLEDGLHCDTECKAVATVGEPCAGSDRSCVADAYCDLSGGNGFTGTCAQRLENGADCSSHPGACGSGYCNEDNFICAEPPGLSAAECRRPF